MRFITIITALSLAGGIGLLGPIRSGSGCPDGPAAPNADLYCMPLVPIPALSGEGGARGWAVLQPADDASGAAVTPDGWPRHRISFVLSGLPAPASLGDYTRYVAWVASPSLGGLERLGPVANGSNQLGEIARGKFLLLVTAERDSTPVRLGRLVLRGLSPSTRLDGHATLALPSTRPGADVVGSAAPDGHPHDHGTPTGDGSLRWRMPPMLATFGMVQSLAGLEPAAEPYLPVFDSTLPAARPREVVELADGDTLVLTAAPVRRTINGRELVIFGFNGQYPGPLIRVRQTAEIVVDFRNELEWPSAVHWHGIRLENRFDGVPGLTQDAVPPGGRFTYRIRLPDAGVYWYHPHHREDVLQDLGLYGNILVGSGDAEHYGPAHGDEALIVDDLLVDDAGILPYGRETATHALMGRFGNLLLVNGEPRWSRSALRGEVLRLFITNAASTRTFNLSLPGARLKLVAADVGRFERETWVENVVLAPAERLVVDVRFDQAGPVPLLNAVQALDHVIGVFVPQVDTLGVVTVRDEAAEPDLAMAYAQLRAPRAVAGEMAPLRVHLERAPDHELLLTLRHQGLAFPLIQLLRLDTAWTAPVEWSGTMPMMDWLPTAREVEWTLRDVATGRENEAIAWRFRTGDLIKLRLRNDRHTLHPMAHPIHLHGQRFVVLARNGEPAGNLAWKDTALLPAGQTMDLLVEMSNPGEWMLHCHIAEHLEAGMQMTFTVDGGPFRP